MSTSTDKQPGRKLPAIRCPDCGAMMTCYTSKRVGARQVQYLACSADCGRTTKRVIAGEDAKRRDLVNVCGQHGTDGNDDSMQYVIPAEVSK